MERSNIIGILYKDDAGCGLTHDFFAGILESFRNFCGTMGYDVVLMNCDKKAKNRRTYLEQVRARVYDGVMIACIDYDDPEVVELIHSGIPLVTIDQEIDRAITVKSDNVQGITQLVHYVGEMGHKRIAYILGDNNTVSNIRLQSFKEACADIGVDVPDTYIKFSEYRDMDKASYYTEQLLRLKNPPSCILYPDDFAAIGGINVLRARGLEIPKDISITGFDGLKVLSEYEPRLTTVRQDTARIGRIAAEKLIAYIDSPDKTECETVVVETVLEKGRTVGHVYF